MIITLDFETYYDADYTLKKLTTESYIRDPRFEALLVGIKHDARPAEWLTVSTFREYLAKFGLANTVLCHHAQFDGLILSHHFGIKPKRWLCTLSMARYLHGQRDPLSLAALAVKYGLREKTIDYDDFKGNRLNSMDAVSLDRLGRGCARDCDTTYDLFYALARNFPAVEYRAIDTTIRMFTEPKLVGDQQLFADIRDREFQSKNERLYELGVGESDLQSAAKFTALLEAEGVEMEWKDGTSGPIPAIAKTDSFMRNLCNEPGRVGDLANARLEVRSTIEETRAGRLAAMAGRGSLAVYLHYCGAHTRRWSGGDAVNFQNLNRGSDLRRGIRAPEGYLIAAPDQSQGECRILNWLAGEEPVLERFRRGEDPYLPMASRYHGRPIAKVAPERQDGKTIELACGFGMGGPKLEAKARAAGVSLDGKRGVDAYRETHQQVVKLWREADTVLKWLANGTNASWRIFDIHSGRIYHPNGSWLNYSTLKWHKETVANKYTGDWEDRSYWALHGRRGWSKMYGAKLVENVVQWLSRIVTAEAMRRFEDAGYPIVGMSHDDVWLLVPKNEYIARDEYGNLKPDEAAGTTKTETDNHKRQIIDIMRQVPDWAPGLPLDADCKMGPYYS